MPVYPLLTEKQTFFDANSNELSGGKLFVYEANSTTKVTTYAETDGISANSNPIILNSRGEVPNGLYVDGSVQYKLVLAPSTDTDPPTSPIWTRDDLTPLGYVSPTNAASEWISGGAVATQTGTTTFTVPGDQRAVFQVGRRVRATITSSPQITYGTILTSVFSVGLTTVTLSQLATNLDSGLTGTIPSVSLLSATNPALPQFINYTFNDVTTNGNLIVSGTISQTTTTSGDFAVYTSSAAASEPAVRLTASSGTSGVSVKLSNSSLNKQFSMRGRSDGGVTWYVNQTSGGASTSGTQAADIDASGFFNAVRVSENATRVFSRNAAFVSAEQTVTASSSTTVAHGLGGIPALVRLVLRCKTAEAGYAINEEIDFNYNSTAGGAVQVSSDATNCYIVQNFNVNVVNKAAPGTISAITPGNWRWVVRAWF